MKGKCTKFTEKNTAWMTLQGEKVENREEKSRVQGWALLSKYLLKVLQLKEPTSIQKYNSKQNKWVERNNNTHSTIPKIENSTTIC